MMAGYDNVIWADFSGHRRRLPGRDEGDGEAPDPGAGTGPQQETVAGEVPAVIRRTITGAQAWEGILHSGSAGASIRGDNVREWIAGRGDTARRAIADHDGDVPAEHWRSWLAAWASGVVQDEMLADAEQGRRDRGRSYFTEGNVLSLDIADGTIIAQVKGSQLEPFCVLVQLPARDGQRRAELLDGLIAGGGGADVLATPAILDLSGELFVGEDEHLRVTCDCPDWEEPCKHVVAVGHALRRRIEEDPSVLLDFRGITTAELQDRLAATRGGTPGVGPAAGTAAPPPARISIPVPPPEEPAPADDFWGDGLDPVPAPRITGPTALLDTDTDLLHEAFGLLSYGAADALRGYAELEELYDILTGADGEPGFDDGPEDGDPPGDGASSSTTPTDRD